MYHKITLNLSEKFRLNYSETEIGSNVDKIKNLIIKACLKYLEIDDNIYISTVADVPGSADWDLPAHFV